MAAGREAFAHSIVAPFKGAGRVVNPVMRPVARLIPPFALIHHRGRRSGRTYRTPVQAYRAGGHWIVMLPFGTEVDWIRNIVADDGGGLERRGRVTAVGAPRLVDADTALANLPAPARWVMRLFRVRDAAVVQVVSDPRVRPGE